MKAACGIGVSIHNEMSGQDAHAIPYAGTARKSPVRSARHWTVPLGLRYQPRRRWEAP
jgi:hypothetical protein